MINEADEYTDLHSQKYHKIKTMQPRQPDSKRLEITVSNYTSKDV